MSSWQARVLGASVRLLIRRRQWGNESALTRRARRLFGAPRAFRWVRGFGVRIQPFADGALRGEWIVPVRSDRGVILYIHGGGYVSCSPATHRPITTALARLSERRVFSLDYRLSPESRFPAALDDAVAAYEWLLGLGIAPRSLVLAGDSAGGGLVLGALLRLRDSGLPSPAAGVMFSPWTDLAGAGKSLQQNDGRCAMFRPQNIAGFASAYLDGESRVNPYASPVYAELSGLPRLLMQVGSTELLLDDARRVHEKVEQAGGASRLEVFDDVFHGWQMLDGFLPEARAALLQAARFINDPGETQLPCQPNQPLTQ